MSDGRAGPHPQLGDVIRERRLELGWSQELLAERASGSGDEVRQSDISRLERGRVGLPRRARMERIAGALGLPVGELLGRSGWAGAAEAFAAGGDALPGRGAAGDASPPPPMPAAPTVAPTAADGGEERKPATQSEVAEPALRDAIARAHRLRTRSDDLIRRSIATIDRANQPAHSRRSLDADRDRPTDEDGPAGGR